MNIKVEFKPFLQESKEGCIVYELRSSKNVGVVKTNYIISSKEWDKSNCVIKFVKSDYNRRLELQDVENNILKDIKLLNRIMRTAPSNDVNEVVREFDKMTKKIYLFAFMSDVIDELKALGQIKTSMTYISTLNSFTLFRKGEDIKLDQFDEYVAKEYERYLKSRNITYNTISFYMRILRAVYNRGVKYGLTTQQFPFINVYTGIDKTIKRAVGHKTISLLKKFDFSYNKSLSFARDMFMFSFYMRGMSFIDLAYLKKSDIIDDTIVYHRKKTGQRLVVKIESCIQEIIDKYKVQTEKSIYLFPIMNSESTNYLSSLRIHNKRLHIISSILKISTPLTSYVARHSWATMAKKKGVALNVISESMGHENEQTTRIYLDSLDQKMIDKANASLLSIL